MPWKAQKVVNKHPLNIPFIFPLHPKLIRNRLNLVSPSSSPIVLWKNFVFLSPPIQLTLDLCSQNTSSFLSKSKILFSVAQAFWNVSRVCGVSCNKLSSRLAFSISFWHILKIFAIPGRQRGTASQNIWEQRRHHRWSSRISPCLIHNLPTSLLL